jgi:hypothetical protein
MQANVMPAASVAAALALVLTASVAHAIPRTFVSHTGSGAACTRTTPCADFQTAHDATDPGGEINCLDADEFDGATITKSITIDCGGVVGAVGVGFSIGAPGGVVRFRNLTIKPPTNTGDDIFFNNGAALFIENCTLLGDPNSGGIGFGTGSGIAKLFVSDSVIGGHGHDGITIEPQGSGSVRAVVDQGRLERNGLEGIRASAQFPTGVVSSHIRRSVMAGNQFSGVLVISGAGNPGIASVTVDRSVSVLNGATGVAVSGSLAFALLGRSTMMSNNVGLQTSAGGGLLSYGNNHLTGNVSDGAPTSSLALK